LYGHIVQNWRLRSDLSESYVQAAKKLEAELGLAGLTWTIESLRSCETFLRTEEALQILVEKASVEKYSKELLDLTSQRARGFWADHQPEVKLRWQIITESNRILIKAAQIHQALKGELNARALFDRYVSEGSEDDTAWYELDLIQRHLDRDIHNFDIESQGHDSLLKLVAAAQHTYAETIHQLATRFVRAYESAGFTLPNIIQQIDTYHHFVEPASSERSVAYFLVDAFRYEMACELCNQLPEDWKHELNPVIAIPPTVTEVGMAALMPAAGNGMGLSSARAGKLSITIQKQVLKNRADRVKYLEKNGALPAAVIELNQIAPLKDKTLRNNLKTARLVVVTVSDEIDGMWENQPHMARQLQDHIFDQLRRGIRSLFNLGIGKVIITADHGFLAGDKLMVGEPLDPPGGETADLHRRVWVGKGGAKVAECLRKSVSSFGLSGDLELVTPYGMSTFKVPGGSNEYFHGGLSLQELVIPVITISAGKAKNDLETPPFRWTIMPGSKQISTRFFSVTVKGDAGGLLSMITPPRVRIELRAGSQIISTPIAATYGFNAVTHDVAMKFEVDNPGSLTANTITMQITDIPASEVATIYLLDEFGTSLCPEIEIPINVVM